ncbi:hypothetical protein MMC25_000378 [Agyrium rufum]|nr:hypothetical protein [Agyrium rufum]
MTCTGLAQICDIRATSMCMAGDGLNESGSRADEKERESLVYTMALLERLIICEMNPVDILPRTEFSGLDMSSLSEPNETPERGTTTGLQSSAPRHDELSMREPAVSGLEHAQSVFLLDRLMILMRISSSAEDKDYKLAKLVELDRHIQRFLGTVMGESEVMQTPHCPTIARCVRLLFLLHDSILETIQDCSSVTDTQQKQISYAALDTLCKMTLDVACLHGDGEPQAPLIPICCVYTLQAARRQLQLRNQLLRGDEGVSREIDSFVQAEGRYRKMWLS